MWANRYVGLKYRDPGFTCGDLARKILAEQFNIFVENVCSVSEAAATIDGLKTSGDWVHVSKPQPGDILLMETAVAYGVAALLHVGVMVTKKHVLHVDRNRFSVCDEISSPSICHRIMPIEDKLYRHMSLI